MKTLPLKIYPSRVRGAVGFLVGAILLALVFKVRHALPAQIGAHWYMYGVFYGLPVLAVIFGLKGALFPKPQVALYPDGLAYPKMGLRRLPWRDIRGTLLHEDKKSGRRRYFSPSESDRRLDLLITADSAALRQINPVFRTLLPQRDGCTVLPIGLMGARISTRTLQQMIEHLRQAAPVAEPMPGAKNDE